MSLFSLPNLSQKHVKGDQDIMYKDAGQQIVSDQSCWWVVMLFCSKNLSESGYQSGFGKAGSEESLQCRVHIMVWCGQLVCVRMYSDRNCLTVYSTFSSG